MLDSPGSLVTDPSTVEGVLLCSLDILMVSSFALSRVYAVPLEKCTLLVYIRIISLVSSTLQDPMATISVLVLWLFFVP
jgi:hypothetical protein